MVRKNNYYLYNALLSFQITANQMLELDLVLYTYTTDYAINLNALF